MLVCVVLKICEKAAYPLQVSYQLFKFGFVCIKITLLLKDFHCYYGLTVAVLELRVKL